MHISLDRSIYPHQSVYVRPTDDLLLTVDWCRQVIGADSVRQPGPRVDSPCAWSYVCVNWRGPGGTSLCYVFSFVSSAHKLLFDITFGHLGIYDTVVDLEADQHTAHN